MVGKEGKKWWEVGRKKGAEVRNGEEKVYRDGE